MLTCDEVGLKSANLDVEKTRIGDRDFEFLRLPPFSKKRLRILQLSVPNARYLRDGPF
jgi:hypothetical protein